jgi:hypothetical protein
MRPTEGAHLDLGLIDHCEVELFAPGGAIRRISERSADRVGSDRYT